MLDLMYEVPSDDKRDRVVIDGDFVRAKIADGADGESE